LLAQKNLWSLSRITEGHRIYKRLESEIKGSARIRKRTDLGMGGPFGAEEIKRVTGAGVLLPRAMVRGNHPSSRGGTSINSTPFPRIKGPIPTHLN